MPTKRPRRSNNAVQEHAEVDLGVAVQASATLEQVSGAPGTKEKRDLWVDRFVFWWEEVQGHSPDECPNAKDLEHYVMGSMLRGIQGLESLSDTQYFAPTRRWAEDGIEIIVKYLEFTYPRFQRTYRDRIRLEQQLYAFEIEGKLTQDSKVVHQWAGIELARLLIWTLFDHAQAARSAHQVKTLQKLTSILLHTSLISDAGAIFRSRGYDGLETLLWSDMEFRFRNKNSRQLSQLSLYVTLRYETKSASAQSSKSVDTTFEKTTELQKSTRKSKYKNIRHFLPLNQPRDFMLCIPKMMLAFAISSGITVERTLTDILHGQGDILQLADSAFIRPVFTKFTKTGIDEDIFTPAPVSQLLNSIREACALAKVQQLITTRDFQRGGKRELSHISHADEITFGLANSAGQSRQSFKKKLAHHYYGYRLQENYLLRVEESDRSQDPTMTQTGPAVLLETSTKPKRATNSEVDAEVLRVKGDPSNLVHRYNASRRLARARYKGSQEERGKEQGGTITIRKALQPLEPNALLQSPVKRARISFPPSLKRPQPSSQLSRLALLNSQSIRVPSKMLPASLPFLSAIDSALHPPFGPGSASPSSASDPSPYASMLDPVMITQSKADALTQIKATSPILKSSDPSNDECLTGTVDIAERIFTGDLEQLGDTQAMFLAGKESTRGRHSDNDVEFVNLLVENTRLDSAVCKMTLPCPNPSCQFQGAFQSELLKHLEKDVCMYEEYLVSNLAESANPPYAKTYVCIEADCDQRFYTQTGLGLHVRDHIFEPQKCPYLPDCSSNKVFQNAKSLSSHTQNHLKGFRATKCTFKGCPDNTIFRWSEALKAHLIQKHSLSKGAERKAYMLPHKAADVRESPREGDNNDEDNDESR